MERGRRSGCAAGGAVLLLACVVASTAAARAAGPAVCDVTTALTPVGVDSAAGTVLVAIAPLGESHRGWLVELASDTGEATAWPDDGGGRFGGSVGPGPVLALRPCGDTCLQPVRWHAGRWEPLGEPIRAPAVSTAGTTYDLTGTPWVVIHRSGERTGEIKEVKAWAFRLEGREWIAKGQLAVTAVGDLQAVPAPQRKDGVLSGTGLFSASGPPEIWVAGLPTLPPERQGQLIALGGGFAAYLSADGAIYLSNDTGKSWRRSTWTPWGAGTTGIWRQGSDFWVDLPLGDRQGPLQLAWLDRRTADDEKLVLARLGHEGDWVQLANTGSEVKTRKNDRLPLSHLLVPRPDVWLLLSGCATTGEGSGLVVRTFAGGALGAARFVALRPVS
jgi:hypothetical protein